MEFSEALLHLRAGKHVKRTSWGDDSFVTCVKLPALKYQGKDFMIEPCFVISVGGVNNMWTPLVFDILSNDWESEKQEQQEEPKSEEEEKTEASEDEAALEID